MEDMELIIKLSKKTVNRIKDNARFASSISNDIQRDVIKAIINGIILPKGHGRILDEKDILDTENNDGDWYDLTDMPEYIAGLNAIIEADKEEEGKNGT